MMTATRTGRRDVEAEVRAHQEELQWYLHFLGCPRDDIPDVAQEAFVQLLRSERHANDRRATAAWLRTTARNLLYSRARSRARRPSQEDLDVAETAWVAFQRDDRGEGWLDALRSCLAGLTQRQRESLELRHGARWSIERIAARIGLRPGGAKTLLERTRRGVRECVERRMRDE